MYAGLCGRDTVIRQRRVVPGFLEMMFNVGGLKKNTQRYMCVYMHKSII